MDDGTNTSSGSKRHPAMMGTVLYGAPPADAWPPSIPSVPHDPFVPLVPWPAPPSSVGTIDIADVVRRAVAEAIPDPTAVRRKLRVSVAKEGDGVKVKIAIDGVVVSEVLTPGASIVVEADV